MINPQDAALEAARIVATEAVKAVAAPAIKEAIERIKARLGNMWSDDRIGRAARILIDAEGQAIDAGFGPSPVHDRILEPLLANGSLETEPELIRRWASLLANAASWGATNKILPGYIDVLRQLTPIQAAILDWLYGRGMDKSETTSNAQIVEKFQLPVDDFALFMTDFQRLNILRATSQQFEDLRSREDIFRYVRLTTFGFYFIRACQPPSVHHAVHSPLPED